MEKLLERAEFRLQVFKRDNFACVICGETSMLDAHHIIERRLWDDGGYYVNNGATLCDKGEDGCHYKAETTEYSVEKIREAAGIDKVILPEDFYYDQEYDKWGNIILANGSRTKGPLFANLSVQKVLKDRLHLFTDYVKYPRTYHLPWSPGINEDDRVVKDTSIFRGRHVAVTLKMDGENFSGYRDYSHARSVDGRSHYTRDWAKNFWMQRSYNLPEGWKICAENMYAVHSIRYENLESYLLGFSIWDDCSVCLPWQSTKEWFELLEMPMVPILYEGIYDEELIKNLWKSLDPEKAEGYVIRNMDPFPLSDFRKNVAKFVRPNHVATTKHWMYGAGKTHQTNSLKDK